MYDCVPYNWNQQPLNCESTDLRTSVTIPVCLPLQEFGIPGFICASLSGSIKDKSASASIYLKSETLGEVTLATLTYQDQTLELDIGAIYTYFGITSGIGGTMSILLNFEDGCVSICTIITAGPVSVAPLYGLLGCFGVVS